MNARIDIIINNIHLEAKQGSLIKDKYSIK